MVADVRRQLGIKRVGHAGTLDPFATGLLIVMINKATRLFDYLTDLEKTYEGVLRLGEQTDTDDGTGIIIRTSDTWTKVDKSAISSAMRSLVGQYLQTPPVYSAKKVRGEASHRRVRRGEDVELAPKEVTVSSFELTQIADQHIGFRVRVSTGTYVRAIARDLGEKLGCGAHLIKLRRTAIGPFSISEAIHTTKVSWEDVRSPSKLVEHLQHIDVDETGSDAVLGDAMLRP